MLVPLLALVLVGVLLYVLVGQGAGRKGRTALDSTKYSKFSLKEKIAVSHDSYIFRFALHAPDQTLGLPIGQHIAIRALCDVQKEVEGADGKKSVVTKQEMIQHSYTPISCDEDKGYVDFMIKVYMAGKDPKFPFGGRLSQHLYKMNIGDSIEMMGPKGHFEYLGKGNFRTNGPARGASSKAPAHVDAFAMVGGGTGITPLLQVMRAIHRDPEDTTKVYLVFCNRTEDDILLRTELDELARERPKQFHVWYTLTREQPPKWAYSTGHVDEMMLRKHLPVPAAGQALGTPTISSPSGDGAAVAAHALLCGPGAMLSQAVKPNLAKLGYTPDTIFTF